MSAQALTTAAERPRPSFRPSSRPELRLVEPPRHSLRWLVAGLLLAAAGVFGVVSLHAAATEATFAAADLQTEVNALRQEYDELTAEVAALESPEHVRRVAVDELGMVPASRPDYLVAAPQAAPPAPAQVAASDVVDPLKATLGTR